MPMVWSFGKLMIIQSFKDTVVRYAGCLIFRITANQVHFLGGLAIFHTPPTSDLVWKIAKPPKKCTWLAVEAAN